jgi:MoaA/NifB/PqqE/SkfB family radical SAM enzyme
LQINHELLSPIEESKEDPQFLSTVPILVVHAHSSCNCRCIMCDIWKSRDHKKIGVREIKPHLESIRRLGVRWIVFSGGEPLMNAELPEMCALLRAEGIHLTLLSTGLLLKKCAADVAQNFSDIIVSLDGPREIHDGIRRVRGAFDLLREGIQALRNLRADIKITARSTVQKANHGHLMETVHTAKELQLDGISFLAVDLTSTAFNRSLVWPLSRQTEIGLSLAELGVLENEIESLIAVSGRDFEPGFVAESPQKLRRLARHFRAQLGLAAPESPLCNAPWVSAVIEADGSVRPCFFHPSIGKLSGTTLGAVINGPEARGFRSTLDVANNSVCRNCVCSLNYRT